jgi:hypothetical protein
MANPRETIFKCAEDIVAGDETKNGIVAGVGSNADTGLIAFSYHDKSGETFHHPFAPVEVFV